MRLLIVILFLGMLSSCVEVPVEEYSQATTSPIGNSQATLLAGKDELRALAIRSTALALDLAQAAATETAYVQHTDQAQAATKTARAEHRTATHQVILATATAQAIQTHTAAQTQVAQITQTAQVARSATAWPQTATPLAATQAAIVAGAIQTERRLYWSQYVVPFWIFIGAVVLVLILAAVGYTYKRLLPVLELRARTIISPDGELITFLPASNEIKAILPARSAGPALHSGNEESQVSGMAPDMNIQDRTLERQQTRQVIPVSKTGSSSRRSPRISQIPARVTVEQPTPYHIVQSGERPPLLDRDTLEILEGQWREIHE